MQQSDVSRELSQQSGPKFGSSERRNRVMPLKYQLSGMALNLASRLNNEWAAGILVDLWFTVFKGEPKPWVTEFWQQADASIEIQLSDKTIPVYLWGEGPLVVMMHGWSGSGFQYRKLIPLLVKAGYQVATFDGPAHGVNPGKKTHLREFVDTLTGIQRQLGAIDTLMAHSLGGMAAAYATHQGLSCRRMVLFGPQLNLDLLCRSYSDLLNLRPRLSDRFRVLIGQKIEDIFNADDVWTLFTPANLLKNSDCRGLLIYDHDDEEIPPEQFEAVAQQWQGSEVITTNGLGHNGILKDEQVVSKVAAFMQRTA